MMDRKPIHKPLDKRTRGSYKFDRGDIVCFKKKYSVIFFCRKPKNNDDILNDYYIRNDDGMISFIKLTTTVEYKVMDRIPVNGDKPNGTAKRVYYPENKGTYIFISPFSYLHTYCMGEITHKIKQSLTIKESDGPNGNWDIAAQYGSDDEFMIEFDLPDEWELSMTIIGIFRKRPEDKVVTDKRGDKQYWDNYTRQGVSENPASNERYFFLVHENVNVYPPSTKNKAFPIEAIILIPSAMLKKLE